MSLVVVKVSQKKSQIPGKSPFNRALARRVLKMELKIGKSSFRTASAVMTSLRRRSTANLMGDVTVNAEVSL